MLGLARLIKENGGKLSTDLVQKLKQSDRECTVPISCHPLTASNCATKTSVWSSFGNGRTAPTRLATDSSGGSNNSSSNSSSDGEDSIDNSKDKSLSPAKSLDFD